MEDQEFPHNGRKVYLKELKLNFKPYSPNKVDPDTALIGQNTHSLGFDTQDSVQNKSARIEEST